MVEAHEAGQLVQKISKYAEGLSAQLEIALYDIEQLQKNLAATKNKPERSSAAINPKNTGLAAFYGTDEVAIKLEEKEKIVQEKAEDEARKAENRRRKADGLPLIRKPKATQPSSTQQSPFPTTPSSSLPTPLPTTVVATPLRHVHFQLQRDVSLTTPHEGSEDDLDSSSGKLSTPPNSSSNQGMR